MTLTKNDLEGRGYEGFISFAVLRAGALDRVPRVPGTYVVIAPEGAPAFSASSRGGHFKGKDPGVDVGTLEAKWVDDAAVVYVGKAEVLRRRLNEFCRFGAGAAVGHWGGRYVWQVEGSDEWLVAWKSCEELETALAAEASMLNLFAEHHNGRLPFANLRR